MPRSGPRIDRAEILSFKLEVPLPAFQRLSEEGGLVSVEVRQEKGERLLVVSEGQCRMLFAVQSGRAQLTGLELADDERGLFFQRVVGPLMVQFRGDLHVRLYWNTGERNRDGDHAEVRIHAGETNYPGLGVTRNALANAGAGGAAAGNEPLFPDGAGETQAPRQMTADDEKVEQLLAKARAYWDEYQKLKRGGA